MIKLRDQQPSLWRRGLAEDIIIAGAWFGVRSSFMTQRGFLNSGDDS